MMLEKLLLTILEISIASSPVILLLLLISPLLGKRYSSKLRCLVWLALAVRMIIPLNMPLQNSIAIKLFPSSEVQAIEYGWFLPNPVQIIENESELTEQTVLSGPEVARRNPIRITAVFLAGIVWVSGIALFLLYHLGAYFYTLHRLRRWSIPIQDEETLNRFAYIKKELSISGDVQLLKSSKAASPLLMGFARPRMILPEKPLTQEQLDFMLRHELWHLKRGDLWYKLLMLLANAVHWFNPLVRLMDRQAGLDTELACDTDVLLGAEPNERKAYGYTILNFMEQGWRCKTPLTSRFYGGKSQMKQRFFNITDTSDKKRGIALFCAIAVIIALAGCAVQAVPEQAVRSEPATEEITAPIYTATIEPRTGASDEYSIAFEPVNPQSGAYDEPASVYDAAGLSVYPYSGGEMAWPFPDNFDIIAPIGENVLAPNDIHTGIDIAGDYGDAIIAANDGIVTKVSREWKAGVGYGMYVMIEHGGEVSTLYANCSKILVSEGDRVVKGKKISEAGATGFASEPQLHFEVRVKGMWVDPMPYITSTGFIWPVSDGGYISGRLGSYPGHTGMDIAGLPTGSPVYAAAAGTVTKAANSNVGYGKHIMVDHGNGYQTLYAHSSELYVSVGDVVSQGQTIAAIGRTGNATLTHLHFEIRHNGSILNPEHFLPAVYTTYPLDYAAESNPLDYIKYDRPIISEQE